MSAYAGMDSTKRGIVSSIVLMSNGAISKGSPEEATLLGQSKAFLVRVHNDMVFEREQQVFLDHMAWVADGGVRKLEVAR